MNNKIKALAQQGYARVKIDQKVITIQLIIKNIVNQ